MNENDEGGALVEWTRMLSTFHEAPKPLPLSHTPVHRMMADTYELRLFSAYLITSISARLRSNTLIPNTPSVLGTLARRVGGHVSTGSPVSLSTGILRDGVYMFSIAVRS